MCKQSYLSKQAVRSLPLRDASTKVQRGTGRPVPYADQTTNRKGQLSAPQSTWVNLLDEIQYDRYTQSTVLLKCHISRIAKCGFIPRETETVLRLFLYSLQFLFKCDDQLVMRLTAFVNFEIFVRIFFTNMIAEFVDLLLG